MTDDPNKQFADRKRIALKQKHEVAYWTKRLGVEPQLLRHAITAVGCAVEDVERYLGLDTPHQLFVKRVVENARRVGMKAGKKLAGTKKRK